MSESKLTKEEILNFLRKNKDFFRKNFDVDNIILFGSYARDEATPASDIDILLEAKKKDFDKQFDLKELLEKQFSKKVDLAYIDTVRPFIMHFIKKELIYV
ncbi:MAG: nucleotidyltransferase domain-containing protein [bacterium]